MEEPTADDLLAAAGDLEAALAAIPGPRLISFQAVNTPGHEIVPMLRLTNDPTTRTKFLVRALIQYEGTIQFYGYITDKGFIFSTWYMEEYLTIPLRNAVYNWFNAVRHQKACRAAKARLSPIKEELMAAAWAPARVAKLVAAGAWDLMD